MSYTDVAKVPAGWVRVDVRRNCREHQVIWSAALRQWHTLLLGRAGAVDAWALLLPGSRLHLWQEPIRPLLFALGIWSCLKGSNQKELFVVGAGTQVGTYLAEFGGPAVDIVDDRPSDSRLASWANVAFLRLRAVLATARRWRPIFMSRIEAADVVSATLCLSAESIRRSGDHYFGRSLETINSRVHWLHQLPGTADARKFWDALRASGRTFSLDFAVLSLWDLVWCAAVGFRLRRRMRALRSAVPAWECDGLRSLAFARRYFDELLADPLPYAELALYRATLRVLRTTRPKAVCFPYEEKGAERALIMAAHAMPTRPTTVAFAHSAYGPAHLYLGRVETGKVVFPRPDVIASAGRGLGPWFRDHWERTEPVVTVGSPRYVSTATEPAARSAGDRVRVLALTGVGAELFVLRDWLGEFPSLLDDCDWTIRPHPHGWHRTHEIASAELGRLYSLRIDSSAALTAQLDNADLVLYCSTSTAAEAIQRGRLVAYVAWDDLWCSDPIRSLSPAIRRCQNPQALRRLIEEVAAMSRDQLRTAIEQQQALSLEIYTPFDAAAFDSLVRGTQ